MVLVALLALSWTPAPAQTWKMPADSERCPSTVAPVTIR
jgi:hypothetical protein